ncbi:putative ATP-dependent RNA helicase [Acanthamoeba polyphaga mimivirus]|nr:putative ATP-dependent RNA helicase [Mimivirus reunion]WMV61723.1 putative ATP-dependent RNA helicase [Mimivirus sp.]WMV62700.1 putative ATP-dependent RNA helicase [Acanthamoeba polyphaga mimivirus]WMV63677.1 putative ATP-dependent RNA helicase [Mimivirus sp.]
MALNTLINNNSWDILPKWIEYNDEHYKFLSRELINVVFPILRETDKQLLLDSIILVINMIHFKFGFGSIDKPDELLWHQLIQNNLLDSRAILNAMLPYINDNAKDDKKHRLRNLEDLYLEKDDRGQYVYTNSQYNRCIRRLETDGKISVFNRPFIREYFLDHLEILLMSIETSANKLYVNWVDVLPVKMSDFDTLDIYKQTVVKLNSYKSSSNQNSNQSNQESNESNQEPNESNQEINQESNRNTFNRIDLINNYIDPNSGLSYQDIYNTISNHLFHEIKNYKWLIYDIVIAEKPVSYLKYLENKFDFDELLEGRMWSQLDKSQTIRFQNQWNSFLNSSDTNDNTVLHHFYFFFSKYHKNSQKLIRQNKLVLNKDPDDEEDIEENVRITPETTQDARRGMSQVPIEEIYLFFSDQLTSFKKTWYFYTIQINKKEYVDSEDNIIITPKNIYNYCKSLVSYTNASGKFTQIPKYWYSLKPEFIEMILIRILDINDPIKNDWTKNNWFNINNYIRKFYPDTKEEDLPVMNYKLHSLIRNNIVDIIFESLIFHGILSNFKPNLTITDNSYIRASIGSTDDNKRTKFKHQQMAKQYFTGKTRTEYETNAYYYLTGQTYDQLKPLRNKTYHNFEKKYFDFLTSEQIWTFTYAMNWVSQLNFYHHYSNNRVLYITGATGVGKSTQVPKLLMYSQKMLDYNSNGKIICTQPRVPPTVENADTISRELGVPIRAYNKLYDKSVFTSNFYVQYKHQKEEHIDRQADYFLRIVTDGTLLEEMIGSPFLTRSIEDPYAVDNLGNQLDWVKTYSTGNVYDIVIVDEAHEHNANMDMILTLARDSIYVNNSTKLVIVSATMDDDEPIYRRYYRRINDNRTYPLSAFIDYNQLDRANMDRRIHISPPGATTQYVIRDFYLTDEESALINEKNFIDYGIKKTIELANSTTNGDILLFMTGQADIHKSIKAINAATPPNIVALGYYSELSEETKEFIVKIHQTLASYTRYKEDVELDESEITRRVPKGTYTRAIIIATNVAEASITLKNLKYVVDTGYNKVVVYDPIDGVYDTWTLPISFSSAMQRRGRVGRLSSGDFYALYSLNKVINNKTAYKIADINIKDTMVKLIKSYPNDPFIISPMNDINQISNLVSIVNKRLTNNYVPEDLIYDILNNPRPYYDIINKQYLYIPDLTDISQYYTYYGKSSDIVLDEFDPNKINLSDYLRTNHDDYHFQQNHGAFYSRCYTGYDNYILEDQSLTFYIIHPDENIINRNLYTGQMDSLKIASSIKESYYYYLLKVNNIQEKSDLQRINFRNFQLIKYPLAMSEAELQMLIMNVPAKKSDLVIRYTNIVDSNINSYTEEYYSGLPNVNINDMTRVKSLLLINLGQIQSAVSLNILNNYNNILWYSYAIPYQLNHDVLAIMVMIDLASDINQWIDPSKSRCCLNKFLNQHFNKEGDIKFLWDLWKKIQPILIKNNLLNTNDINYLRSDFNRNKEKYLSEKKIPFNEFLLFDKLFNSGKLNTTDEFYYYVNGINFDFVIENNNVSRMIEILSENELLNKDKIIDFVSQYLSLNFTIYKQMWSHQYEIENKLNENSDNNKDIVEWVDKNLRFPNIITHPYNMPDDWDKILETYIRALSTNVVKNQGSYYLKMNNGVKIFPSRWSRFNPTEKTFLNNKSEFIIYHSNDSTDNKVNIMYLTPVQLKWILDANPIYYYYLIFDKNNIINKLKETDNIKEILQTILSVKPYYSIKSLIEYVDRMNNPTISRLIRSEIYGLDNSTKN